MKIFVWSRDYPVYEDRLQAMSDYVLHGCCFVAANWTLVAKV